jgi:hypothetical protein
MGAPATPPPAPNPPVLTTPCPSSLRYPNCSPRAGVRGLDGVITLLRYPSLVTRHSLLETRTRFKEDCDIKEQRPVPQGELTRDVVRRGI